MNKRLKILFAFLLVALIITAFIVMKNFKKDAIVVEDNSAIESNVILEDNGATPEMIKQVVNANNILAFDFYNQYSLQSGNLFFPTYSISNALMMAYKDEEEKINNSQQEKYMDDNSRRLANAKVFNELDDKRTFSTDNSLWLQDNMSGINEWVLRNTDNYIISIISSGYSNPSINKILSNSMYFDDRWAVTFDKRLSREEDFIVSPTQVATVQMMTLVGDDAVFNYAETDKLQAIELPYKNNEISMIILLPKDGKLRELEETITLEEFNNIRESMSERRIDITLPKFRMEKKYFSNQELTISNVNSTISENKDILTATYIDVNEDGSRIASATIVRDKSAKDLGVFTANHPFMVIILDKEYDNILLIGRVSSP